MSRIKVINYEEATGELKAIYENIIKTRKKLAEVHKIQSLHPKSITAHMDLYMEIMFSKSELSRAEREMIAVVVSVANGCKYCQTHHAEALNHYWKNPEKIENLKKYQFEDLTVKEKALCEFAIHLTNKPHEHENEDFTIKLKRHGISDNAILDTVLVISYFNFVNRIVLSLGVELETDNGTGYNY